MNGLSAQFELERERMLGGLGEAIGQALFSAIAGPRGDYLLGLELGERQRRSVRLANPRYSFLQRTYEGEFSFLIECPWRLDGPNGVVCSALEMLGRGAPPTRTLGELEGRPLEEIQLLPPGWDLALRFGTYWLRIFALEADPRGVRNNWIFWSPSRLIAVGARGHAREQSRIDAETRFRREAHRHDQVSLITRLTQRGLGAVEDEPASAEEPPVTDSARPRDNPDGEEGSPPAG